MARVRTFIAVDIGDAIRKKAVALQQQLMRIGAAIKWVDPAGMHITLQFLGEVDDRDLATVCSMVKQVAHGEPPIALRVAGVGAFPTPRRPKVVWAGITNGADSLQRVYGLLGEKFLTIGGFRQEERAYTPHLTLGLAKSEAEGLALVPELPKYLAWDGGLTTVDELLVMSSELRREGPEYTVMGRGQLRGKGGG